MSKIDKGILSKYDSFSFSLLDCSIVVAKNNIVGQMQKWGKRLCGVEATNLDVRAIYESPNGPANMPAIKVGVLISEINGPEGPKTLFVSSVADGYNSLVTMFSEIVSGLHYSFSISRNTTKYPRNALTAFKSGEVYRVVYSMREESGWKFFEKGSRLSFENAEQYAVKMKRDRLSSETISSYLKSLGYGSIAEDFWISDAPALLIREEGFVLGNKLA